MEANSTDKRMWTWASEDGTHAATGMNLGPVGTEPGGGGEEQPYDGYGRYLGATGSGGFSGGSEVRGKVTRTEREMYPPSPPAPQEPHLAYSQSSGGLLDAQGELAGRGYSRKGEAKNRPEREGEKNVGPIPRGNNRVVEIVDDPDDLRCQKMGPHILRLEPADSATCDRLCAMGREGFYIHGGGTDASTGCIIMGPKVRSAIGRGTLIHVQR
jgi:hypothetical protein